MLSLKKFKPESLLQSPPLIIVSHLTFLCIWIHLEVYVINIHRHIYDYSSRFYFSLCLSDTILYMSFWKLLFFITNMS